MAVKRYNKAQMREDNSLQRIRYAISAAVRPLDVLGISSILLYAQKT